ncbi:MAG: hypothetical protein IPO63_03660 [Bacteroidetes bacterium]|nr:hypothetical protein [Bacteroidota bacterium]
MEERIAEIDLQVKALQHDVANESKSSAGDKHETSRAMMNLEQEKLDKQYQELTMMKERFDKINFDCSSEKIQIGSLIETNKGIFLLSVGFGKIQTAQRDLMLLSIQSPLEELLNGKKKDDRFKLNTHEYIIISVI